MEKIRILIAEDIEETRELVKRLLSMDSESFEVIGEAETGYETIQKATELRPDVILMDINMPELNGLDATEEIFKTNSEIITVIMSVQAESEYLKRAMSAGARDYIIKPLKFDILVDTIKSAYNKHNNIAVKPVEKMEPETIEDKPTKIFTVFSSKGGVGKSFFAINSAIMLSKNFKKKTLLIDLDLQFGDVSILLNEVNNKTIMELVEDETSINEEDIRDFLFEFNDHLDILFAPRSPESAEYISRESVKKVIKIISKYYEYIIIDTGVNYNESTLFALDIADKILYFSAMDIISLKNTKLGYNIMDSLSYSGDKVKLFINMADEKKGVTIKEVEKIIGDVFAVIPYDSKEVVKSINSGHPFVLNSKNKNSKVYKSIKKALLNLVG